MFAYTIPTFRKEEIAGLIVSVNPENFDKIEHRNSLFTYFKAGSIGKYLHKNDLIIFYSEPSQKYPKAGIKGYGEILEVYHGDPDKTWDKFKLDNPIFTADQYHSYASNKKSMLGLKVSNFRSFEPLSLEYLKEIFDNTKIKIDDLCNNYISKTAVNKFNEVINKNSNIEEVQTHSTDTTPKIKEIYLSEREKNIIRIATVQIDYNLSSSFPFEIRNKKQTLSKIYRALEKAKEIKCDIICFPELSFCEEWLLEVREKFSNMIIIAGSYYNSKNNNSCQILFGPDNFISSQEKITPAMPEEGEDIQKMVSGDCINIYKSRFGTFAVLICIDFDNYEPLLRNKVDIIFVPSSNKDTKRFFLNAEHHVQSTHSYIVISNCAKFGGTAIFGVVHSDRQSNLFEKGLKKDNQYEYKLCEIKEKKDSLIVANFDIVYKAVQKPTVSDLRYDTKPVQNIEIIKFN